MSSQIQGAAPGDVLTAGGPDDSSGSDSRRRVVVVTGAGSGIGRGIAQEFADEGAIIVVVDRSSDAADDTVALITARGGRAVARRADVTSSADVEAVIATTIDSLGRIDVLVSNAGIGNVATATSLSEDDWDAVLDTNLKSVWLGARAVLPHMVAQGSGAIVNMASITALRGYRSVAAYSAAKGGVLALTRQMATDYADTGVRINALAPGTVHTPLTQGLWDQGAGFGGAGADQEAQLRAAAAGYPIGRLGMPEDVAALVCFLASARASWITGSVFLVDGGKVNCS